MRKEKCIRNIPAHVALPSMVDSTENYPREHEKQKQINNRRRDLLLLAPAIKLFICGIVGFVVRWVVCLLVKQNKTVVAIAPIRRSAPAPRIHSAL